MDAVSSRMYVFPFSSLVVVVPLGLVYLLMVSMDGECGGIAVDAAVLRLTAVLMESRLAERTLKRARPVLGGKKERILFQQESPSFKSVHSMPLCSYSVYSFVCVNIGLCP